MPKTGPKRGKIENYLTHPWGDYILAQRILRFLFDHELSSTNSIRSGLTGTGQQATRVNVTLKHLSRLGHLTEYQILSCTKHSCESCKKSHTYFETRENISNSLKILENNKNKRDAAKKKKNFKSTEWFRYKKEHVLGRFVSLVCTSCRKQVDSKKDEQYRIQKNYRYWSLSKKGVFATIGIMEPSQLSVLSDRHKKNKVLQLSMILLQCDREEVVKQLINRIRNSLKIKSNILDDVNDWYVHARSTFLDLDDGYFSSSELSNYKNQLENERIIDSVNNVK
ncbi:MAG: hypothetical protein OEW78_05010 [Nitrosopumilus sp.]|uniref:hypothetical protein n=1 Tax=Nitrosopumilus sp. TaxID=2024843 RepID=UPI00246EC353|nr:hypothetical protein [Nitrosopumilus sp.]MDH5431227.1 hypothetical protein [Nitrosopumilus sp.]MDH5697978.1 hypothetical protein [Nitrosopumilus sp.]